MAAVATVALAPMVASQTTTQRVRALSLRRLGHPKPQNARDSGLRVYWGCQLHRPNSVAKPQW